MSGKIGGGVAAAPPVGGRGGQGFQQLQPFGQAVLGELVPAFADQPLEMSSHQRFGGPPRRRVGAVGELEEQAFADIAGADSGFAQLLQEGDACFPFFFRPIVRQRQIPFVGQAVDEPSDALPVFGGGVVIRFAQILAKVPFRDGRGRQAAALQAGVVVVAQVGDERGVAHAQNGGGTDKLRREPLAERRCGFHRSVAGKPEEGLDGIKVAPQIAVPCRLVGDDFFRAAFHQYPALLQNVDAVAYFQGLADAVVGDDDADVFFL